MHHTIEYTETRDEATDLQEYYESKGLVSCWHKADDGRYIVECWEEFNGRIQQLPITRRAS